MNFGFSEDQQTIKATARELLADRSPMARVREAAESGTADERLWRELCELGWPGIAVPEEHGGQGLGAVELAVLLEELGYAVAATPFLGSVARRRRDRARGRRRAARPLAARPRVGRAHRRLRRPRARRGRARRRRAGHRAGRRRAGARGAPTPTSSRSPPSTRRARYGRVAGEGEPLPGDVAGALDRGAAAIAAELVGVCQRALDMTVAYVSERRQFGVPVGAFQAVAHRCAQMLLHTEGARSAAYFAAWAADAAPERLAEAAGLARVAAGGAGTEVTGSAIQAHGGIGFTWEADVHWLFKRAQLDAVLLGGGSAARIALARLVAARAEA